MEILRKSPVLRLGENKTVTLRNVRPPAKTLALSAEAAVDASATGKATLTDLVEETVEKNKNLLPLSQAAVALVFGPENGAVSQKLVFEAAKEAYAKSYAHLYVIGFAIQPTARELIEKSAEVVGVPATYVQATPDLLMGDLLKNMRSSQIFSVCGLPEIEVSRLPKGEYQVKLLGLDVFDPVTMDNDTRDGSDVPCWLLDTDYNDLCFHVSQAFFPRTGAWENLKRALRGEYDESVWAAPCGHDQRALRAGREPQDRREGHRRPRQRVVGREGAEMSGYEVPTPILNSPFHEPAEHWNIVEGEEPERLPGRRPAMYFYRDPGAKPDSFGRESGTAIELILVNRIRRQVKAWRDQGYPGASRTTLDLLQWWRREGRRWPLFFAQLEAAETIIFLIESRADFRQGLAIPCEGLGPDKLAQGYRTFLRYACKMATGTGKTTVMGMIAAWSILNKVNDRGSAKFSDVVLVVCPNVTIRSRLAELDPAAGPASLYITRDLVPPDMRDDLTRGRVLVTNWHVFEPRSIQTGGTSAKVNKAGVPLRTRETDHHRPQDHDRSRQPLPYAGGL